MNPRDPCIDCPDEVLAVYVVVNGSLGMSSGKIVSQTFQVAQRLFRHARDADPEMKELIQAWEEQGTRTISRIATSEAIFDRVCRELPGVVMCDEGLTEVPPNSNTMFATFPIYRGELPRMLKHRKVPLLTSLPTSSVADAQQPNALFC
jgi:peptidyl-tRNA hydrolase